MKTRNKDFYSLSRLLFEQEEGEDEPVEEEAAEEEAAEEGEPVEEEEEEEEEPPEELTDTIDADIEAVLIDFEAAARKTVDDQVDESIRFIYEAEDEIDLDLFAGEVARLVKNYENLLDMEKMLVDKAKSFITNRYGEEEAKELEDKLATQHDIEVTDDESLLSSDLEIPLAVGATFSGE